MTEAKSFLDTKEDFFQGRFGKVLETELDLSKQLSDADFEMALLQIHSLIITGRILESADLTELILSTQNYQLSLQIKLEILKAEILIIRGEMQEMRQYLDKIQGNLSSHLTTSSDDDNYRIHFKLVLGRYYLHSQDFDLALNYFNEAILSLGNTVSPFHEYLVYKEFVNYEIQKGEYQKAIEYVNKFIEKYEKKAYPFLLLQSKIDLVNIHVSKADLDTATELLDKIEEENEVLSNPEITWQIDNNRGIIWQYQGKLSLAKDIHFINLERAKELKSDIKISGVYNNLGNVINLMGAIDEGLNYNFKSLEIVEKIGRKQTISMAYNNIAINYMLKGDLERALEYLITSKRILEELQLGGTLDMATAFLNLGQIYHMKGDYELAERYYQDCLQIDIKYGNELNIGEDYYNLLTLSIEREEIEDAKEYLEKLEEVNSKITNDVSELRVKLGRMLILKSTKRSMNMAKAQEILLEVVGEEPVDYELYIFALLNLCELLLLELRQNGLDEVLDEIKVYIDQLHNFAFSQQSYIFLAETYLLKSKIAMLDLDFDNARSFIEKAEVVTLNRGLDKIGEKISLYYDEFLDEMNALERLIGEDPSVKDRLSKIRIEELLSNMISTKAEQVVVEPENPTMFMILEKGGLTLYKKTFVEESTINDDLIAGLLSALYSLSGEVFNTKSSTQRIKHEDYTVITKPLQGDQQLLFCYVFEGHSFNALRKLDRVTKSIVDSHTIWDALNREVANLTESERLGMDLILEQLLIKN